MCLIAIYGPNNDSPEFFGEIRDIVDSFSAHFTILCGDWNLVLSPDLDLYNYNSINNPRSREVVLNLKNDLNLTDPWRIYNPTSTCYTWHRKNHVKMARLDFFSCV